MARLTISPLKIALLYAAISAAWILFSDQGVRVLANDTSIVTELQTFKGWVFILVSSAVLYYLMMRMSQALQQSEVNLSESENRFQILFNNGNDAIYVYRLNEDELPDTLIEVNDVAARRLGYERDELLQMSIQDFVTPEYKDFVFSKLKSMSTNSKTLFESAHRTKEGKTIPVEVNVHCFLFEGRRTFLSMARDITECKNNEWQLREMNETLENRVEERTRELVHYQEQLRRLVLELSQAEQRERRQLADLLHDHLQQMLVAASMRVNMARNKTEEPNVSRQLGEAGKILEEAIQSSRSLTAELKPPALQEAGFLASLHWLAESMKKQHNLEVTLELDPAAEPRQESMNILLFWTVRELLLNVIKHAQVEKASLSLIKKNDNLIQLTVSDSGIGFDGSVSEFGQKDGSGFGLFGIRERIQALGGKVVIQSQPGNGTQVHLLIPYEGFDLPEEVRKPMATKDWIPLAAEPVDPRIKSSRKLKKVLLVDDHAIVREGVANILKDESSIEVIGQAANGFEAVETVRNVCPDVVVMDINMPRMNGIEATRIIKQEFPHIQVIALSVHDEASVEKTMKDVGVSAYLNKGGDPQVLINTIMGIG